MTDEELVELESKFYKAADHSYSSYEETHDWAVLNVPTLLQEIARLRLALEEVEESKANAVSEAYSQGNEDGYDSGRRDYDSSEYVD